MSDLEKKAWTLSIFKTISILIAVVSLAFNFGGKVEGIIGSIGSLKTSIDMLVINDKNHFKQDSTTRSELSIVKKDIDSLKKALAGKSAVKKHHHQNVMYVTQVKDANGHIILKPVNN